MTSKDSTFTSFTPEQAAAYARTRGTSYPAGLYDSILDYHRGARQVLFDVGTGPGKVVLDLWHRFDRRSLGCDTGEQMIARARMDAERRGAQVVGRTRFFVCGSETCGERLDEVGELGRVDVMTVAMAAHWFDLERFYDQAAKALRPGGTLAVWTCSSWFCHPSVPNHTEVQAALSDLEDNLLGPYMQPGNVLAKQGYERLELPWDFEAGARAFEAGSFVRHDWDRNGVPSASRLADGSPGPFLYMEEVDVDQFEDSSGSSSAYVRWRQANPDKVGTDDDVLRITARRLEKALGKRKTFFAGPSCSLLLMRRQA